MKKIYFLYPAISGNERYSSNMSKAGSHYIPLGIFYLASYMREKGYSVKVRDAEADACKLETIIEDVKSFEPDFIGISSTTVAFHKALEAAAAIKSIYRNSIIILGGPHISADYKHAMSFKEFDYGIYGEGEITLYSLCECLSNDRNIENIDGIIYRNKEGKLIKTKERHLIENLDMLPFPAYDLINNIKKYHPRPMQYKKLPVINIITSRGCPGQCTFCCKNVFGNKYRQRSAENIFNEIKMLKEIYMIREISFCDETFLLNKKRIYLLFNLLEKAEIKFIWTCMSRISDVDYEYLKFLKEHGCWHISFGIESGDERIIKKIKKNINLEKTNEVINWCYQLKIKTAGFFIIGHPNDTIETINRTIHFAVKSNLDDVIVTMNTPFPGTQNYEEAPMYGVIENKDNSLFNFWEPIFIPNGMTKEVITKKHKEFYRKFYLRPKIMLKYIFRFLGRDGLKRFVSILIAAVYLLPMPNLKKK